MRRLALVITCAIALPSVRLAHAATVLCVDAVSGRERSVPVGKIRRSLTQLRRDLKRRGVHVLDLSSEAQAQLRQLQKDEAERAWCRVRDDVATLSSAATAVVVDQPFVTEKLSRIERWVTGSSLDDEARERATALLAAAHEDMAAGRLVKANVELNTALALVLGSNDLWLLPERMPTGASPQSSVHVPAAGRITDAEVALGCPELAKRTSAARREYESARERLAKVLDERQLRPLDVKDGVDLVTQMNVAASGEVWLDAARAACVVLARARAAEIDLGLVMARFRAVNHLQDSHPLSDADKPRFSELVRLASDDIAARRFDEAYRKLEELLVLMGLSAKASAMLDPAVAAQGAPAPDSR